uniref:Uncharacterized protein n=1 Tax=Ananas comosus var. bracteatus TaxID=296719 RepID=A0A6V7PX45_ANACO|nr:unnamed protein product [Ananas comosus var. bracteatus]
MGERSLLLLFVLGCAFGAIRASEGEADPLYISPTPATEHHPSTSPAPSVATLLRGHHCPLTSYSSSSSPSITEEIVTFFLTVGYHPRCCHLCLSTAATAAP